MYKGIRTLFVLAVFGLGLASCNSNENPVENKTKVNAAAAAKTDNVKKSAEDYKKEAAANAKKNDDVSSSSTLPKTALSFVEVEHHFGTINEGDKPETVFTFTNNGTEDLIIEKCKGSCGCTVPQCPKEPIPPGATGEIKVVFNSKGKKNHQEKRVTVTANTDPIQTQLKIIADVIPEGETEVQTK